MQTNRNTTEVKYRTHSVQHSTIYPFGDVDSLADTSHYIDHLFDKCWVKPLADKGPKLQHTTEGWEDSLNLDDLVQLQEFKPEGSIFIPINTFEKIFGISPSNFKVSVSLYSGRLHKAKLIEEWSLEEVSAEPVLWSLPPAGIGKFSLNDALFC